MKESLDADYVLQMAQRVEQNGQDFYLIAARRIGDPTACQLLMALADREGSHAQTFGAIRKRLAAARPPREASTDVDGPLGRYVHGLYAGKFFDPAVGPEQYFRGNESPQDIVMTAIGQEKESILFYEGLKQVLASDDDLAAVDRIIREETQHISDLAGLLAPAVW